MQNGEVIKNNQSNILHRAEPSVLPSPDTIYKDRPIKSRAGITVISNLTEEEKKNLSNKEMKKNINQSNIFHPTESFFLSQLKSTLDEDKENLITKSKIKNENGSIRNLSNQELKNNILEVAKEMNESFSKEVRNIKLEENTSNSDTLEDNSKKLGFATANLIRQMNIAKEVEVTINKAEEEEKFKKQQEEREKGNKNSKNNKKLTTKNKSNKKDETFYQDQTLGNRHQEQIPQEKTNQINPKNNTTKEEEVKEDYTLIFIIISVLIVSTVAFLFYNHSQQNNTNANFSLSNLNNSNSLSN